MSGSVLHFDFSKNATRRQIFGSLIGALPDELKGAPAPLVNDATISATAHLHDLPAVERAINTSIAGPEVKEHAKAVYRILAEAEAAAHGCSVEETHFHEVGLGMTCREILGICTAIQVLAPEKITATSVQVGSGTVECSHGTLDIPAPATAAILQKYEIPVIERKLEGELCTPTSAALIAHFVEEFV